LVTPFVTKSFYFGGLEGVFPEDSSARECDVWGIEFKDLKLFFPQIISLFYKMEFME
jgi:hypothetical protein